MRTCAFFRGTYVSFNKPVQYYMSMGETALQELLDEGVPLKKIRIETTMRMNEMSRDLRCAPDKGLTKDVWKENSAELVERWCSCVHILLRLKVIQDDEANGWGYK